MMRILRILFVLLMLTGCDVILPETMTPRDTPVSVRVDTVVTDTPDNAATSNAIDGAPTATPPQPSPTPTLTPTPMPFELESAIKVMSGICFESAADAAGRVFIMRSAEEHILLYDLAENSGLCRMPIIRNPFDFNNGRILAGTWTYGIGCDADHEIRNVVRDDANQQITIDLQFITYGDCPYELVRPFWVAFDNATDYDVTINVTSAE